MFCCACAGSCNHIGNHSFCVAHGGAVNPVVTIQTRTANLGGQWLCPDLLRLDQIGPADNWRGRVVRGFFRVLRVVTGV